MSYRTVLVLAAVAMLGVACAADQLRSVERFNAEAEPIQIACLDFNGDGAVNGGDGDAALLTDITGDGLVDDADVALVGNVDFALPNGKPDCDGAEGPTTDWQVGEPAELDCAAGERGVVLLAIGGGAVDLNDLDNAAGVRWMVEEIADDLEVGAQIASVAPGLKDTAAPQRDAEAWSFAFLSQQFREQPCLKAAIIGHSHGGSTATAVAARLENEGFGGQILLTALIDRVASAYSGDSVSIPQTSPVVNLWLPAPGREVAGHEIQQQNVDNLNVEGMQAPEHGEEGGKLGPITHTNIDNSEDVLREIQNRVELLTLAPEW